MNSPVFAFTNVYQKRKHSSKPKMITYIDGPFYPNLDLDQKERIEDLRDKVYNAMVERSNKYSTYEYKYHYVKKEEKNEC